MAFLTSMLGQPWYPGSRRLQSARNRSFGCLPCLPAGRQLAER